MRVDLHIHSAASDGALPPAAVPEAAAAGGLDVIALADHDTAEGFAAARAAAPPGLHVLPAIEISAFAPAGERHVLGYGIDPRHDGIARHTEAARAARARRMAAMVEALAALGHPVPLDAVVEEAAGAPLARPHLARVMVAAAIVGSHGEAFARFLGDGGPAYVPNEGVSVADAVQRIHAAGGLSIWAHPPREALAEELDAYVDAGLDGLEVYRPRQTKEATRRIARIARGRGLLASGGSDWHGPWDVPLGSFAVRAEDVAPLLEAVGPDGFAAPPSGTRVRPRG
jgi:predicted metal-dependent phosphoesterase TrpH